MLVVSPKKMYYNHGLSWLLYGDTHSTSQSSVCMSCFMLHSYKSHFLVINDVIISINQALNNTMIN